MPSLNHTANMSRMQSNEEESSIQGSPRELVVIVWTISKTVSHGRGLDAYAATVPD